MVRLVSSVRFRQGARPWRRSSVGQSTRLIIVGSPVRVRPPLLPSGQRVRFRTPGSHRIQSVSQSGRRWARGVTVAKNDKRIQVTLACEQCKRRNYITTKNKLNDRERIEMKKFCRWDRQHTLHKETRRL